MQYEMFNYGATSASFYLTPQSDRGRKRLGSTSTTSNKDGLTSKDLVSHFPSSKRRPADGLPRDVVSRTESRNDRIENERRTMPKVFSINWTTSTRSTRTSSRRTTWKSIKFPSYKTEYRNSAPSSTPFEVVSIAKCQCRTGWTSSTCSTRSTTAPKSTLTRAQST
jgi:hypothetical protein